MLSWMILAANFTPEEITLLRLSLIAYRGNIPNGRPDPRLSMIADLEKGLEQAHIYLSQLKG